MPEAFGIKSGKSPNFGQAKSLDLRFIDIFVSTTDI
jgi:hypothetical protein